MWKSKRLSDETIKIPATSDNSLPLSLNDIGFRTELKFDGHCLKQGKVTFNYKTVVIICIIFKINLWPFTQSTDFVLGNYLFEAVNLTKNAEYGKYKY